MKKIDVIRSGSLSSIIGPAGTMKRIIKNSEYFKSRGYDINIFTHDSISSGKSNVIPECNATGSKNGRPLYKRILTKISKKARLKAKHNTLLANFYLKKSDNSHKRLINYYLSLNKRPDIVVLHSEAEAYWFLRLNKSGWSPKIVTFLHSDGTGSMTLSYFPCIKGRKGERHLKRMLADATEGTDKLVFISQIAMNRFKSNHPDYPLNKIGLAVNGIEDFTEEEKSNLKMIKGRYDKYKYRLCCTGTINRRKGQRRILETLSRLPSDKLKDIHVSFIGDGPEKDALQEFVIKHRLENNVTFEGTIANAEVYKYLAEHNIFILMSDNEGLPISIIEAMRAGLPVISTNVAGIPETVDDNGILLNLDNEALFDIMNNLDQYDWEHLGQLSRKKFERDFLFSRMAKDYCDIMDSIFN